MSDSLIRERRWVANPPAPEASIAALAAWWPHQLPRAYLGVLRESDGGHGEFNGTHLTYARLWSAANVVRNNSDYQVQQWVPGLLAIGDNGGCDVAMFDARGDHPWPVLSVPFAPMEMASAVVVAESFEAWMTRLRPL
jgi:hypothetical protein